MFIARRYAECGMVPTIDMRAYPKSQPNYSFLNIGDADLVADIRRSPSDMMRREICGTSKSFGPAPYFASVDKNDNPSYSRALSISEENSADSHAESVASFASFGLFRRDLSSLINSHVAV